MNDLKSRIPVPSVHAMLKERREMSGRVVSPHSRESIVQLNPLAEQVMSNL